MMEQKIFDLIEEETGGDGATRATALDTLALDSLEFLNLMARIEQETGKTVPDEKLAELGTVGELVDYLAG